MAYELPTRFLGGMHASSHSQWVYPLHRFIMIHGNFNHATMLNPKVSRGLDFFMFRSCSLRVHFVRIPQRELQIDICTLMIYIYIYTLAISIYIYTLYVHYRYIWEAMYIYHISGIFPVAKSSDFPIAVPSEAQKTGEKSRAGTRVSYPHDMPNFYSHKKCLMTYH